MWGAIMDSTCYVLLLTVMITGAIAQGTRYLDCSRKMPKCNIGDRRCCGCPTLFFDPIKRRPAWPAAVISNGFCRHMKCITASCKGQDASCNADTDCGSNTLFCANSRCTRKLSNGFECTEDRSCLNGHCVEGTCSECRTTSDCTTNHVCEAPTVDSTLDYHSCVLVFKEFGEPCVRDKDCISEKCTSGLCGNCFSHKDCDDNEFCLTSPGEPSDCKDKLEFGDECTGNVECKSAKCTSGFCGNCFTHNDCEETEYCAESTGEPSSCEDKLEFADECRTNEECISTKCTSGFCGNCFTHDDCDKTEYCAVSPGEPNSCKDKLNLGEGCTTNDACRSDICIDSKCVECADSSDCPEDKTCDIIVHQCVEKVVPAGEVCLSNELCETGICVGSICEECISDSDCDDQQYCATPEDGEQYKYKQCSTKKSLDETCSRNQQCKSEKCTRGLCGECFSHADCGTTEYCMESEGKPNYCKAKRDLEDSCETDEQCLSEICIDETCVQCNSSSDCDEANQEFCFLDLFLCKVAGEEAEYCETNEACKSGKCIGNTCVDCATDSDCEGGYCGTPKDAGDFEYNRCSIKESTNAPCTRNQACMSDKCHFGKCVECIDDTECSSSEYCDTACIPARGHGETCSRSEMCASDLCIGDFCTECDTDEKCKGASVYCHTTLDGNNVQYNRCSQKLLSGSNCSRNEMCLSSNCIDNVCFDCISDEDCTEGESFCGDTMNGSPFKTCLSKKRLSKECSRDQECTSGKCAEGLCGNCFNDGDCKDAMYCQGFGQLDVANDCKNKHEIGEKCIRNGMCVSEKCGVPPGDDKGICGHCAEDRDCEEKGAFCKGLNKRNVVNKCATKIKRGEKCDRNEQCWNSTSGGPGFCDTLCGDCVKHEHCGEEMHCRGSGSTNFTNECKPPVKNNRLCQDDTWCASGHCINNLCKTCGEDEHCGKGKICNYENKCRKPLGLSQPCFGNNECISNYCKKGKCKEKKKGRGRPSPV